MIANLVGDKSLRHGPHQYESKQHKEPKRTGIHSTHMNLWEKNKQKKKEEKINDAGH